MMFIFIVLFLISCTNKMVVKDAQKATAHYQLGVSYLNDNNIQPAFVEFQKALELNPDDKKHSQCNRRNISSET